MLVPRRTLPVFESMSSSFESGLPSPNRVPVLHDWHNTETKKCPYDTYQVSIIMFYMLLNKRFDSGTVICLGAVVLVRGQRPRAKTTVPRTIYLMTIVLHNF